MSTQTPQKKTVFECKQCKFKISRIEKDLNNDCPKCGVKSPYVAPHEADKSSQMKKLTSPSSKTTRKSTKICPKSPEGKDFHTYDFGSCIYCKQTEGSIEDKTHVAGQTAYPSVKSPIKTTTPSTTTSTPPTITTSNPISPTSCPKGAKHMFKFSTCSLCGMSELEFIKLQKAAASKK
jgi:hypothetical protein